MKQILSKTSAAILLTAALTSVATASDIAVVGGIQTKDNTKVFTDGMDYANETYGVRYFSDSLFGLKTLVGYNYTPVDAQTEKQIHLKSTRNCAPANPCQAPAAPVEQAAAAPVTTGASTPVEMGGPVTAVLPSTPKTPGDKHTIILDVIKDCDCLSRRVQPYYGAGIGYDYQVDGAEGFTYNGVVGLKSQVTESVELVTEAMVMRDFDNTQTNITYMVGLGYNF